MDPQLYEIVDHFWWFFLGGLCVWCMFIASAYWAEMFPPDDPPDDKGWQG